MSEERAAYSDGPDYGSLSYEKLVVVLRRSVWAKAPACADAIAALQRRAEAAESEVIALRQLDTKSAIELMAAKRRAEAAEAVVEAARDWRCAIEISERDLRINDLEDALDRLDREGGG